MSNIVYQLKYFNYVFQNMRVRTVKGQDYYSKTGAKFHGKMEQKFLLVDCKKVIYGSYR